MALSAVSKRSSVQQRHVCPAARTACRRVNTTFIQPRPLSGPLSQRSQTRTVSCNGLFGLGLPELAVIAGVAALVFGPSKLPELGKSLGKTVKSFQGAAKEFESELKAASASDEKKPSEEEKIKKSE